MNRCAVVPISAKPDCKWGLNRRSVLMKACGVSSIGRTKLSPASNPSAPASRRREGRGGKTSTDKFMTPVRFGIIGCSSVARRRMLPAIAASGMAHLERIGSRGSHKAEQFAREFGCAKWGSYEAVLADPEVDAIYISTPPALHEPWVRAAAEHRKHILCEKPAFPNRRVAAELIELCQRQGVR